MRSVIRKWGNSAAVRVPAPIMRDARLHIGDPVELREKSGCIVIEPPNRKVCDLASLLKGINRANLHEEVDFGASVGKEMSR
jgi:antitoxin MazE